MTLETPREWQEILSGALNGSRRVDDAAVHRAEDALAEYPDARLVERAYVLGGIRRDMNKISKREAVVLVNHNGTGVTKSIRLGVPRRREDGTREAQQVLIHEMTWGELANWLAMIQTNISALIVNEAMASRLLELRDQYPDTVGPAEACERMGTTIEGFLAASSDA